MQNNVSLGSRFSSGMSESEKRELIIKINNDTLLTQQEKALRRQQLFSAPILENKLVSNESKTCEHYQKSCYKFYFECCGIYDPCKRCHLKRPAHIVSDDLIGITVNEITCSTCETAQSPSHSCVGCETKFSNSYCEICYVWTEKDIYHCEKCGVCRVKEEGVIAVHDDSIGICMKSKKNNNRPKYNFKVSNIEARKNCCAICKENTFIYMRHNTVLRCGHQVHDDCLKEYFQHNYKCPNCKKSSLNMSSYWVKIRQQKRMLRLPPDFYPITEGSIVGSDFGRFRINSIQDGEMFSGEFVDWTLGRVGQKKANATLSKSSIKSELHYVQIYCNDCETIDLTQQHFVGLECVKCGSFNTQR